MLTIMKNEDNLSQIGFMSGNIHFALRPTLWTTGLMTYLGQWNIRDQDAAQGLTTMCATGLALSHFCHHHEKNTQHYVSQEEAIAAG